MGYNYRIILEEKEGDNWNTLYEYSNSGSFNSESNHYFLTNINEGTYQGKDNDEYTWYIFTSEQVLKEYNEINWKEKMKELIDSSEYTEDAIEKITNDEYLPTYWVELEEWSNLILSYPEKELRVRFGISV